MIEVFLQQPAKAIKIFLKRIMSGHYAIWLRKLKE